MLNELLKKMNDEYEEYKLLLESCSPRKIIEKSYETAMKGELIFVIDGSSDELDDESVKLLCGMDKPLDFLYSEWIDCDLSISETLQDSVKNAVRKQMEIMRATEKEEETEI
ncbi:MAG: DUF3848 domain-containing protein [Ruminiclostridium sp.]|nr:DUF3848 domain-containing protein [Ruminiclostridium sp.]